MPRRALLLAFLSVPPFVAVACGEAQPPPVVPAAVDARDGSAPPPTGPASASVSASIDPAAGDAGVKPAPTVITKQDPPDVIHGAAAAAIKLDGGLGTIGAIGHGAGTGTGSSGGLGQTGTDHSPTTSVIRQSAVKVTGVLPPEVVQRVVRQQYPAFRQCYEKALHANPKLEGRVSVKLVIDAKGDAGQIGDAGSDLADPGVVSCVVAAMAKVKFPQPEGGGTVSVVYPLTFKPSEPPK